MPPTRIKAHQFLHGYDDGHRLLRNSVALSPAQQKLMLILSDLSGPSLVQGFDSYLTGYPLLDVGAYAVARTWYASEMKRPGCVWTHTLMLSLDDLVRLSQPQLILRHFRRPSHDTSSVDYAHDVDLEAPDVDHPVSQRMGPAPDLQVAKLVLSALYREPDKAVLIPSRTAAEYEETVLSMWAQQPPVLRTRCGFCTGALAPRTANGRLLDIQVVPRSSAQHASRSVAGAVVVLEGIENEAPPSDEWLSVLTEDLMRGEVSPRLLRRFLADYAWQTEPPRTVMKPLTEVYRLLTLHRSALTAGAAAELLAERFPSPKAAPRL